MIGHWNVSLLAFGLVCVAGCMQESVWRGVMRSLDNFSKAASNNRWCEGAWPPQLAGTREGKRGWLIVWPCEDFSVLWNLRRKTWELQDPVKTRTTYFVWVVYLYALKGHSLHIDKTSQSVSGRRKPVHVTKWEETQKSCGGDLKKKKKEWFGADPPSQLQTGDLRRQVEPTIGSLLLSEEWTCASVSACLFLDTPRKLWRQTRVCLVLFFFIFMEKTIKHSSSLGFFVM